MSTHPDLQPIGRAYGLDVEEVHRALRWASIAKQAARGGTSKGSALGFAAAPSPPKSLRLVPAVRSAGFEAEGGGVHVPLLQGEGDARMREPFHCLPSTEAGAPMPSGPAILAQDKARAAAAERGSASLLKAIQRYYERQARGDR